MNTIFKYSHCRYLSIFFFFFHLALIFIRLSKRIHHNKYILTFPATTVNHRHTNDTDVRNPFLTLYSKNELIIIDSNSFVYSSS